MCFKPSMIHYMLSLSNIPFLTIIIIGMEHIHTKKQIMLYNTFNIHENSTLPFLIPKYMFIVEEFFSNYVVLMIKNTFRH